MPAIFSPGPILRIPAGARRGLLDAWPALLAGLPPWSPRPASAPCCAGWRGCWRRWRPAATRPASSSPPTCGPPGRWPRSWPGAGSATRSGSSAGTSPSPASTWTRSTAAQAGRRPPEPWAVAFGAGQGDGLPPLRHVLLGMNAHINYDLAQSLLAVISRPSSTTPALLASRRADHEHIDQVLVSRVGAEDTELEAVERPPHPHRPPPPAPQPPGHQAVPARVPGQGLGQHPPPGRRPPRRPRRLRRPPGRARTPRRHPGRRPHGPRPGRPQAGRQGLRRPPPRRLTAQPGAVDSRTATPFACATHAPMLLRMKTRMIQIRHVPEDVHRKLKERAQREGMSLSDYLLQEVTAAQHSSSAGRSCSRRSTGTAQSLDGVEVDRPAEVIRRGPRGARPGAGRARTLRRRRART